ncbi:MAG: H-NS histone family protein [Psychrobacter sp.]|nr:H-NS histone family protein [Psychrobacter sp.]
MDTSNVDSNVNVELNNNTPLTNSDISSKESAESESINNIGELDFLKTKSLSDLTSDQLRIVEESAKKEREGKAKKTLIEAWQIFVAAAEDADLTITNALSICNPSLVKGNKKVSAIKYRDPDNKERGWTGRGRKPTWFTEKLKSGVSEKDMRA